jgi:hypothetical protein
MYTKVFENRVFKGPELTGGWRNFRNEKLHDLQNSSNIKVIKSKVDGECGMFGGGDKFLQGVSGSLKEGLGVDGRIILKWIFSK